VQDRCYIARFTESFQSIYARSHTCIHTYLMKNVRSQRRENTLTGVKKLSHLMIIDRSQPLRYLELLFSQKYYFCLKHTLLKTLMFKRCFAENYNGFSPSLFLAIYFTTTDFRITTVLISYLGE